MPRLTRAMLASALVAARLLAADGPISAPPTAAADSLTVDALVAEVVRANPELDFYRAEIAAARAGRRTAARWDNPDLEMSVGSKRVWERHGPAAGDGVAWSVSIAQGFEWPGRLALRKAIANGQIELAQLGLERFQAALAVRVRAVGHAMLSAQEKATAAAEVAQRFQALLGVLVQRDNAGVTPLLDLRIIEANAVTLHRRAAQAEQERQAALLELNQLRGSAPATPLRLRGSTERPPQPPAVEWLLQTARTNNFDVRMRVLELAQQGFLVELSQNERWPTLTLAPYYSSEKAADEERIVGVGLSLPLPLWHQNRGNIEAAQARQQQAEASLQATLRLVENQVASHALALQAKLAEMSHWRPDAPQQFREAAALADRHYRLGAVPLATYLEMQTRYLEALDALLATSREALEHRQQLELLVGQPLAAASHP